MQAIILAGGKGKRLRPITENIPKALVEVGGTPMLQRILDQLKTIGVSEAILIVSYQKEKIKERFGNEYKGIVLTYAHQKEMLGDANALTYALPHVKDEKVLIIACDNLFPTEHLQKILKHESDGVMSACKVTYDQAKALGVLFVNGNKITKIIEKSPEPPSTLANVYVHYMPRDAIEACKTIKPGAGGEYKFVDAIQTLIDKGKTITYEALDTWLDVGTHEQLKEAHKLARKI